MRSFSFACLFGFALSLVATASVTAPAEAKPRAKTKSLVRAKHTAQKPAVHWTALARQVGQSETEAERTAAIRELRRLPDLSRVIRKALDTSERPLALEVISALEMQALIPELTDRAAIDRDGFTAVALNSMLTDRNKNRILKIYAARLQTDLDRLSDAVIVAFMEPIGRLSYQLPRSTLVALKDHASPDVRASLLYYLRLMALRAHNEQNVDLVADLLQAPEYQVRLQAQSITSEMQAKR